MSEFSQTSKLLNRWYPGRQVTIE